VAGGENENDLNHSGLYLNKTVMVIIIQIYGRAKFLPASTCKRNPIKLVWHDTKFHRKFCKNDKDRL
jgi:hypothetical protein